MASAARLGIARVLTVDLGGGSVEARLRPDLAGCLGGSALATRLFAETASLGQGAESPSAGDQPFVMAIGPLTMAFPAMTKTAAVFRSPLTGNLGESHAGGRLAMAMRFAGYDALVVTGRSSRPVYLSVLPRDVRLKDATPLWGVDTEESGRILRELDTQMGGGKRSIVRIGPAGEAGVAYAGVNVDTYRHFGRLGLGAVMGAKRLKAIVVRGDLTFPLADPKRYSAAYQRAYDLAVRSPAMNKYHELGTAQNVLPLNAAGGLPTRNLASASFEGAEGISGETLAAESLLRKVACAGCPVGCIHIGLLREEFAPGHEYRYNGVSYDHELIYALGSLLGIGRGNDLFALIEGVEKLGLDAMTTGAVLAWLTEAGQKGLVPTGSGDGLGGISLAFGEPAGYLAAMERLVEGAGEPTGLWSVAARGTRALAQAYGGDFDLQLSGNEVSGYHTGYGTLLNHLAGARHSHLDSAGYALDQKSRVEDPRVLVDPLLAEEQERCVVTSLHACLFARKIYGDRALVRECLGSLGMEWTDEALDELGRSTLRLKHRLKAAMGFSLEGARLPDRFFQTPSSSGVLDRRKMEGAADLYRQRIEAMLAEAPAEFPWLAIPEKAATGEGRE